jgi:uncharacterized delta-60 repeat protein
VIVSTSIGHARTEHPIAPRRRLRRRAASLALAAALSASAAGAAEPGLALDQIQRWWSYLQLRPGASDFDHVVPERSQVGGVVNEQVGFGTMAIYPPGRGPAAKAEVFADETGHTYWVGVEAPPAVLAQGDPYSTTTLLEQYQYFVKTSPDASLQLVVTDATMEMIDDNGGLPTAQECPWHVPGTSYDNCRRIMWATATFTVEASRPGATSPSFFRTGGFAELTGWRGTWSHDARTHDSAMAPFWKRTDFGLDPFVDGSPGHARLKLRWDKVVNVPLESIGVGEVFYVFALAKVSAINVRQRESYVSAFLRDPVQTDGLSLNFSGVEPIETPAVKPPAKAPLPAPPCAGGASWRAGRLTFTAATYDVPEIPGDGAIVLVRRAGGARGPVSARFRTVGGTASPGSDYAPVDTQVLFADGERGVRAIRVPIIGDGAVEGNETVTMTLTEPGGCATLGRRTTAELRLLDDDRPPVVPEDYTLGGTVAGLVGTGLVLEDVVTGSQVSPVEGPFTFGYLYPSGSPYDVRVVAQPVNPMQVCTVTNGTGTIADADVTDVAVDCVTPVPNGALDPGFGSQGKVTTGLLGGATAMALQPDGKIVLLGRRALARYHADGSVDGTFGTGGEAAVVFNGAFSDAAQGLALQPDGKIVVVGFTRNGTHDDFAVVRYDAAGGLDPTFGTGGKVVTDFGGAVDKAWAVLVQPDGRIVAAGHAGRSTTGGLDNDFALARYTASGELDVSFGTGGRVTTDVAGATDLAFAAALQGDGKILVTGRVAASGGANPDVGIVRYHADGAPDHGFGTLGIVRTDFGLGNWEEASDLAVQPDGKVVVAVQAFIGSAFAFTLGRVMPDGTTDLAFGVNGLATFSFAGQNDYTRGVALQADGKIVAAGQASLATPDLALVRLHADGSPDAAFGTGGSVAVDFFGSIDSGECLAIQPDGKIVAAGAARNGSTTGLALMRVVP